MQIALVAIALVLSAVFLPMAFFGGSTGVIYRQFSMTIVSAMVLSVLVALILSPALTATLLKPEERRRRSTELDRPARSRRSAISSARRATGSTRGFERLVDRYRGAIVAVIDRKWLFLGIYALVVAALIVMFLRLPTGFLPTEDQGAASVQFRLPAGATQSRTLEVQRRGRAILRRSRGQERPDAVHRRGRRGGGGAAGQNTGQGFINFAPWDERKGKENTADAIVAARVRRVPRLPRRAGLRAGPRRDPRPWPVERLHHGAAEPQRHEPRSSSSAARDSCSQEPTPIPKLASVRISDLPDVATSRSTSNQQKLTALGLNQGDVNTTLSTAWGGRYVNDFIDQGRVKRVYVQGDAPYRADPSTSANGTSAHRTARWRRSPPSPTTGWAHGAEQPVALPRRARLRDSRASRRRASAPARRWTRWSASPPKSPAPASPGPASPIRSGCRPGRRRFLYARLAAGRLPVPRRALRELVDPGRGPAGHSARPGRRDLRGDAARAGERRLPADRPADDDGPRRQERDPDDRVRRAGREEGHAGHRRRARGRPHPACGRS